MTLLARREGMSTSDFRSYWAGPHAKLALGMAGISRYVQNRVDKVLWCDGGHPVFCADGIVELFFASEEAMGDAQGSRIGSRHIPQDEPNFLKGWTLCIVDTQIEAAEVLPTKVMVPFLRTADGGRDRLATVLARAAQAASLHAGLDWTATTARRPALWTEPHPPMGCITLWFPGVAAAHDAFDEASGSLRRALVPELEGATAYLVDALRLR